MTEVKKETMVTSQLLEETLRLKKGIKEAMMAGEFDILNGIVFFEEVVREVNPEVLDEYSINKIRSYTLSLLGRKEEGTQRIKNNMHYGVERCFLLMEGYSKRKTRLL